MRDKYNQQLAQLDENVTRMGALCEESIALAVRSLGTGDDDLLDKTHSIAAEIDQMERDIETLCPKLLLKQQPVATDLRRVSAALKMITDLERIGDQASDIAEISAGISERSDEICSPILKMAKAATNMVNDSITSFVQRDVDLARYVIDSDDAVDQLFADAKADLAHTIAAGGADGETALDMLMIAKYLERIADHATNVAEWAEFACCGARD